MLGVPVLDETNSQDPHAGVLPQLGTVCVVGLGYVGLPVAVEFGKRRTTVGFDLATRKVERLKQFNDPTGEVSSDELQNRRTLDKFTWTQPQRPIDGFYRGKTAI